MAQFNPDFMHVFVCKRGDCRRTCCSSDWEISLTKEEFEKNRSKRVGEECQSLARKYLRRNPNGKGDKEYALCLMRGDGFCNLLTEGKLCAWQALRGECVGTVCTEFPKTYSSFREDEYVLPTVACEAVAELLLKKADPIRLVSASAFHRRNHLSAKIDEQGIGRRPLLRWYPELIRWGLALLQDRRFSLDDRFVLLAHAMCLIDWTERNGRVGDLPHAMGKFLQMENLQQTLRKYDPYTIGPKAFLAVNVNAFVRFMDLPRYQAKARHVLEGLGIEIVETEGGRLQCGPKMVDSEIYLRRKETLARFMRQKETFLEHTMVCEYLRSMMPITEPGVWNHFQFFNVCYALHKGILYGSFDSAPGDAELVDAIVLIHRMFIHNYRANQRTFERLNEIRLTDLTSMVALAKG
jgi:hypothetical protein